MDIDAIPLVRPTPTPTYLKNRLAVTSQAANASAQPSVTAVPHIVSAPFDWNLPRHKFNLHMNSSIVDAKGMSSAARAEKGEEMANATADPKQQKLPSSVTRPGIIAGTSAKASIQPGVTPASGAQTSFEPSVSTTPHTVLSHEPRAEEGEKMANATAAVKQHKLPSSVNRPDFTSKAASAKANIVVTPVLPAFTKKTEFKPSIRIGDNIKIQTADPRRDPETDYHPAGDIKLDPVKFPNARSPHVHSAQSAQGVNVQPKAAQAQALKLGLLPFPALNLKRKAVVPDVPDDDTNITKRTKVRRPKPKKRVNKKTFIPPFWTNTGVQNTARQSVEPIFTMKKTKD
jgi:hypothetical protein